MKIGIDYRLANNSNRGMGRYCREIVNELLKIDSLNQYYLIIDSNQSDYAPKTVNCHYLKIKTSNYIIGEQIIIPRILYREKFDVFWSPSNTIPLLCPKKTKLLVTIHDVIFLYPIALHGSLRQRIGALYRRTVLKLGYKRINQIFTVSEFSKKEILRNFSLNKTIEVTYNCIDKFENNVHKILTNGKLVERNYFFTVSGDAPSKNLDNLLQVFEELPNQILYVAGLPENSPMRRRECTNIQFIPSGIPDTELIRYYLSCKCFLFFSIYEGFGIPLLEAVACRRPILASNTTSIPEILNGNFYMTSPDKLSISKAIEDFINNKIEMKMEFDEILSKYNDWRKSAEVIYSTYK